VTTASPSSSLVVSTFPPAVHLAGRDERLAVRLEVDRVGDDGEIELVRDGGGVVESVDAVGRQDVLRGEVVVELRDRLRVDVVVELLAVGNGVDGVDAVAIALVGEIVDGAADDREVEVATGFSLASSRPAVMIS